MRIWIETAFLALGLLVYFGAGFYLMHWITH